MPLPAAAPPAMEREQDSDDELIRLCRKGQREAFVRLYDRYKSRVYSFALTLLRSPEDAEDATQDVFRYVFGAIPHYDARGRFKSYIFKICHSISMDILRRRGRQTLVEEMPEPSFTPPGVDERLLEDVRSCYGRLSRAYREVLALRVMDDLSYEEIAEVLGIPVGTVKSRLHHAVEGLRRLLRGETIVQTEEEP